MSKLTPLLRLLLTIVTLILLGRGGTGTALALGCQIYPYQSCNDYGQCITLYYDGCSGDNDYCPPNHYRAPDGNCYENGTGGACACGTLANGSCRSCGAGGGECWNGATDCPAGTVRTSTPSQTFCRNNDWGVRMCGNIGSAQAVTGCCRPGPDDLISWINARWATYLVSAFL